MQWYNYETNELSTIPPWGNGWLHPEEIAIRYFEWKQVDDSFVPVQQISKEQILIQVRQRRDQLFQETQWIFMRQMTGSVEQKLSDSQYQQWLDYWTELRNFPSNCDTNNLVWPIQPSF